VAYDTDSVERGLDSLSVTDSKSFTTTSRAAQAPRSRPDSRSSDHNPETQRTIRSGSIKTGDGRGSVQPRVILRYSVLTVLFAFNIAFWFHLTSKLEPCPLGCQVKIISLKSLLGTRPAWLKSSPRRNSNHGALRRIIAQLLEWGKHRLRETV
jgi:hypothetical protein